MASGATGDPAALAGALFADGHALIRGVLDAAACREMRGWYADDALFRSRVIMQQHNFGRGEYRYFRYPLPAPIERLRTDVYAELAPIADRWMEALRTDQRFPATLPEMLALSNAHEQARPTPLLLKYGPGDFNALHQDLYGELAFPLQVTLFLSEPGDDYTGGEFVLAEGRPRRQTRVDVLTPRRGDMLVFPNSYRPVAGARGTYRASIRHGVSTVRSGERYTLGIIFHDAR